ncbi:3-deoxy-D-manno-octulosonic-acid transferase [Shimia isoporae]|uniref:3-deoxy-D-manno-octulosonic acid transferase n=1 Tax=Shimia isoporae TaxID=647720 RepID=A0A4R1NNR1_9RHOB|nr:glycosyltransferase N-terminal domain-containing protein [Shimia isoporae]TCL09471.1 3-deoxy-D-manno-octulosonic-acid transferase [Shimia isoporae]
MSPKLRLFLAFWTTLWNLGLPLVLLYLRKRAKKDPLYAEHLSERFGKYDRPMQNAVWVHAVSLGELRSAVPMIRALLDQGEKIVVTQFTPAGRRETEKVFADEIAAGTLQSVWIPIETSWAYRRFFKSFLPKFGLVMEIEIWPRMVLASERARVPLFMCNAQYPTKSMTKDAKAFGLRSEVMTHYAGAFVKSDLQRDRFSSVGVRNIHVTGELRFDQPVPAHLPVAGRRARHWIGAVDRLVVTFASTVEGEDALYIDTIRQLGQQDPKPLVVYVPRRPELFSEIGDMLESEGFSVLRRSQALPNDLTVETWPDNPTTPEILLGDSLGEMYFYLSMADRAVVGGGFMPQGAHNIIEPLAMKKPVITGPQTWTIEYPFEEAKAAGVARTASDAGDLANGLSGAFNPSRENIDDFFAAHAGGTQKFLNALPMALKNAI